MTAMYDRSRAGAVMLKIATIVWVEPIPMQLRQMLKRTTSQTALTGVCVYELTLLQNLEGVSRSLYSGFMTEKYPENGKASSRANAYAILVSASMAEQPVKN